MTDKTPYAVIKLGAKQFLVKEGDKVVAEKIAVPESGALTVTDVLLTFDGQDTTIGTPLVEKAQVVLTHAGDKKGLKIRVAKFKAKSRYRRVQGHRQQLSHFTVKSISVK
ncbi:50S ribosomal protein L21 [Candidatus Collierbacteria bacterium RIFOXYD1_FULL_40_9]|uniref:Large ribosomal subunit protein bL21 n=1 Tax=Candidatus Collierbacteria bacterium RIFOXYD1_FULL_40_9 TaxID=1817731 RepID=A0A1F5FVP9_9BACT|nr:MAG: 50S ribosomal protein L21 [Candidatus Collierbacteria bacterium RIFOXYD1_FULL_40_9]